MTEAPPFRITPKMLDLVIDITRAMDRIEGYEVLDRNPRLRRRNRVRSIHSSCAIEANSLSSSQVSAILDGRRVEGPKKDIDEVKGAYEAYSSLDRVDPYDLSDLLRMHRVMTNSTVEGAGMFRTTGEGVFSGEKAIFIAPPPDLVPSHMENLFGWMKENKGAINPLILSSVFHYEMVFIHPFTDGNGRMARFWQTAILGDWNELFRWIPIENGIHKSQKGYYEAIQASNDAGESTVFIEFMLETILRSLTDAEFEIEEMSEDMPSGIRRLMESMDADRTYSSRELMELVSARSGPSFRRDCLGPALERGLIVMTDPNSPKSPRQRYRLA